MSDGVHKGHATKRPRNEQRQKGGRTTPTTCCLIYTRQPLSARDASFSVDGQPWQLSGLEALPAHRHLLSTKSPLPVPQCHQIASPASYAKQAARPRPPLPLDPGRVSCTQEYTHCSSDRLFALTYFSSLLQRLVIKHTSRLHRNECAHALTRLYRASV